MEYVKSGNYTETGTEYESVVIPLGAGKQAILDVYQAVTKDKNGLVKGTYNGVALTIQNLDEKGNPKMKNGKFKPVIDEKVVRLGKLENVQLISQKLAELVKVLNQ